jgi:exopolysaccharide biosynthesis polyprenyl glycosylphosphotransferase
MEAATTSRGRARRRRRANDLPHDRGSAGRASILRQLWHGSPAGDPIPEIRSAVVVNQRDTLYRRTLGVVDAVTTATAIVVACGLSWLVPAIACGALLVLVNKVIGLYERDEYRLHKTTLDEAPSIFMIASVFALGVWLLVGGALDRELDRQSVALLWALLFLLPMGARTLGRYAVRAITPVERCLVVGDPLSAERLRQKFAQSRSMKATVVGMVPLWERRSRQLRPAGERRDEKRSSPRVLGEIEMLGLVLVEHDVHRVIFVPRTAGSDEILDVIRVVKALGVKVSVLPELFEVVGSAVEIDDVDGLPLMALRRRSLSRSSELLKRGMDVSVAVAALVLLAPILVLIMLAILADSGRPILFRQRRIGRHSEVFELLKFRTMVPDADKMKDSLRELNEAADGLFKIERDPRCTRVGRFLRNTHLDELPQLWNVVRGEMSLVGPRPLVEDEDATIEGWHRSRLHLTPGMTGHWQILGGPRVPLQEMVKIDHLYVANWSLWLDIKILLRTIPHVLARRGA